MSLERWVGHGRTGLLVHASVSFLRLQAQENFDQLSKQAKDKDVVLHRVSSTLCLTDQRTGISMSSMSQSLWSLVQLSLCRIHAQTPHITLFFFFFSLPFFHSAHLSHSNTYKTMALPKRIIKVSPTLPVNTCLSKDHLLASSTAAIRTSRRRTIDPTTKLTLAFSLTMLSK